MVEFGKARGPLHMSFNTKFSFFLLRFHIFVGILFLAFSFFARTILWRKKEMGFSLGLQERRGPLSLHDRKPQGWDGLLVTDRTWVQRGGGRARPPAAGPPQNHIKRKKKQQKNKERKNKI